MKVGLKGNANGYPHKDSDTNMSGVLGRVGDSYRSSRAENAKAILDFGVVGFGGSGEGGGRVQESRGDLLCLLLVRPTCPFSPRSVQHVYQNMYLTSFLYVLCLRGPL